MNWDLKRSFSRQLLSKSQNQSNVQTDSRPASTSSRSELSLLFEFDKLISATCFSSDAFVDRNSSAQSHDCFFVTNIVQLTFSFQAESCKKLSWNSRREKTKNIIRGGCLIIWNSVSTPSTTLWLASRPSISHGTPSRWDSSSTRLTMPSSRPSAFNSLCRKGFWRWTATTLTRWDCGENTKFECTWRWWRSVVPVHYLEFRTRFINGKLQIALIFTTRTVSLVNYSN